MSIFDIMFLATMVCLVVASVVHLAFESWDGVVSYLKVLIDKLRSK